MSAGHPRNWRDTRATGAATVTIALDDYRKRCILNTLSNQPLVWTAHYDEDGRGLGEMAISYLPPVNNAAARVAMHMMVPFASPEVDRSYLVMDGLRLGEMFESVPVLYVVQLAATDPGGWMSHYSVGLNEEPEQTAVWIPLLAESMSMVLNMRGSHENLSFTDALGYATTAGRRLYGR